MKTWILFAKINRKLHCKNALKYMSANKFFGKFLLHLFNQIHTLIKSSNCTSGFVHASHRTKILFKFDMFNCKMRLNEFLLRRVE